MKKLFCTLVCVFLASVVFAQPTITGVTQSGATMTITGSGFGVKAVAAPVKWDDFQSVPVGSQIASSTAPGAPWVPGGSLPPIASTDRPRPGTANTRNMLSRFQPMGGSDPSASNVFVRAPFKKFFMDAWFYYDTTQGAGVNVKPWRLHAANAGDPNASGLVMVSGPNGDLVNCAFDGDSPDDNVSDFHQTLPAREITNGWVHLRQWLDFGSGNGAVNGSCITRTTTPSGSKIESQIGNMNPGRSGFTDWKEFYIGNYIRSEDWNGSARFYWDAVYVDNSWAHVEIGDAPVYANATHTEIQIPTAWSDGSVTVKKNRGSFPANAAVFAYVCTEANVCSAGRAFTLDGSTTPPPTAACADGLDNDADGLIDLNDPGCANAADTDESNVVVPPAPINCVVSAFTRQSVGPPLGACINGSQTTTEFWTRTITTMPANGGTACPALSENRTGSQACTVTPPPTGCAYNGAVDPVGTERFERLDASFNTTTHVLTVNAARLATLKAAKWKLTPLNASTSAQWFQLICTP